MEGRIVGEVKEVGGRLVVMRGSLFSRCCSFCCTSLSDDSDSVVWSTRRDGVERHVSTVTVQYS